MGCLSSRTASPGRPPRLWPLLPVETRRQLAQHVGRLVQRLRQRSAQAEESHLAEHDVARSPINGITTAHRAKLAYVYVRQSS